MEGMGLEEWLVSLKTETGSWEMTFQVGRTLQVKTGSPCMTALELNIAKF